MVVQNYVFDKLKCLFNGCSRIILNDNSAILPSSSSDSKTPNYNPTFLRSITPPEKLKKHNIQLSNSGAVHLFIPVLSDIGGCEA